MKKNPLKYVRSYIYDHIINQAVNRWSKLQPGESPRLLLSEEELKTPHSFPTGTYDTTPEHKGDFHEAAAVLGGHKGATVVSPDFFKDNPLHQRLQAKLMAAGATVRPVAGGVSIVKSPTAKKYNRGYTHEDFINKIAEKPEEETNHLAYADWLEENDNAGLAKIIRDFIGNTNSMGERLNRQNLWRPEDSTRTRAHETKPTVHFWSRQTPATANLRVLLPIKSPGGGHYGYFVEYPKEVAENALSSMSDVHGLDKAKKDFEEAYAKKFKRVKYNRKEAHPLVAGFRIEHALRHIVNDPNATSDAKGLAASALYDGKTDALVPLQDELTESEHPLADKYNWHAAAQKILDDEAVGHVIDTIVNNHHGSNPFARQTVINGLLLSNTHGSILGGVNNLETDAIKELRKHFTPKEIKESLLRHHLKTVDTNLHGIPGSAGLWYGERTAENALDPDNTIKILDAFHLHNDSDRITASKYARLSIPNSLHEEYNKQFRTIADRLHAKHGVSDLESFKADPFGKLLEASKGDLNQATDVANHYLYDGVIERRHRPNTNLGQYVNPVYVRRTYDLLTGKQAENQRKIKTQLFSQIADPEDPRTLEFPEEAQVRTLPSYLNSEEARARHLRKHKEWNQKQSMIPMEELKARLLKIVQENPGITPAVVSARKLRIPAKKLIEVAQAAKIKMVPSAKSKDKKGGRKTVEFHPPEQFARKNKLGSDFLSALRRLRTGVSEALTKVAEAIHKKLKTIPAETYDVVHDRSDSATVNTVQKLHHDDPIKAKVAAAWYGLQTQTPSLVVFYPGEGKDYIHKLSMTGSGEKIRSNLSKVGLHQRIIRPVDNGFEVLIYDKRGIKKPLVENFAKLHGSPLKTLVGSGEGIGHGKDVTADDDARKEYRKIIRAYEQEQLQNASSQQPANPSPNYANPGGFPAAAAPASPATATAPAAATPANPYAGYATASYKRT